MSATADLARWAAGLRLADVPDEVRRIARLALLDWYAVSWAARDEAVIRIVREEAVEQGGTPVAGLIGTAIRSSAASAAWVNGAAGHALDYDDVHNDVPGHATAPVAPAVLALAEQTGASGAALLIAFIAGYEATVYAARAASGLFGRGYQASTAAGVIGAAVGCGRLLGLDAGQLTVAIGMAATQAAGLQATFGSMAKCYNVGRAAQNGLLAAAIARRGFECAADVIEAPRGFAAVLGDQSTVAPQPLGNDGVWHLRRNLFKLHASCFMTHAAM
ncbi:MAG: MmgE/PrpD family protein, partial [Burkholderiaceae bacterium]